TLEEVHAFSMCQNVQGLFQMLHGLHSSIFDYVNYSYTYTNTLSIVRYDFVFVNIKPPKS
ncbi:MAG: hypothetical protein IJC26_00500, partial [Clostridia bacterium]|nr:hypothetical protein [Clostridia bacterium]